MSTLKRYLFISLFSISVLVASKANAVEISMDNAGTAFVSGTYVDFNSSVREVTFNCPGYYSIDVFPGSTSSTTLDCILDYWNGSAWVVLNDDSGYNGIFPQGYYFSSNTSRYRVRPYNSAATGQVIITGRSMRYW